MADFMTSKLARYRYVDLTWRRNGIKPSMISMELASGNTGVANSPVQKLLNGQLKHRLAESLNYESLIKISQPPRLFRFEDGTEIISFEKVAKYTHVF